MNTFQKFTCLSPEDQQRALDTLKMLQDRGECRPDEWEHIVAFYYDEATRPPDGWFKWWEEDNY